MKMCIKQWFYRTILIGFPSLIVIFLLCTLPAVAVSSLLDATTTPELSTTEAIVDHELVEACRGNCSQLPAECYNCSTDNNCTYGLTIAFNCSVKSNVICNGNRSIKIDFQCRYCFLTDPSKEHRCSQNFTNCSVTATPQQRVMGTCLVNDRVFCLGNRTFKKMMPCSWTSGYSWSTAFALSVTVGGFGVDRFYLGYWREGLGKLFSFGGLGVWTIIDVILIGTSYLSPSDGSLYVY